LILAHIVDWSPRAFLSPAECASRPLEHKLEVEEAYRDILNPLADDIKEIGVSPELIVLHGDPSERLSELADERGVTLVFTGRCTRSRMGAVLFGDDTTSLVRACPVAVTVVP